jgi:hypothetical protein
VSRNVISTGEANFECDNGHWTKVIFHYQDDFSGTVKGFGRTNHGLCVHTWSGYFIQNYLDQVSRQPSAVSRQPSAENKLMRRKGYCFAQLWAVLDLALKITMHHFCVAIGAFHPSMLT